MTSRLVVLDTNVLVSAALKQPSRPAEILTRVLEREVMAVTCPSIISEYQDAFAGPKFKKWQFPPLWFEYFLRNAMWVDHDPPTWPLPGPDDDDLVFLSLAYAHGATLITGNLQDYPRALRQNTSVLDPAAYLTWLART